MKSYIIQSASPSLSPSDLMLGLLEQFSTSSYTNVTYLKLSDIMHNDVVYVCIVSNGL